MTDRAFWLLGDPPTPINAVDLNDGSFALLTATASFGGVDRVIRLGDPPTPFRVYDLNDGSGLFALAVS